MLHIILVGSIDPKNNAIYYIYPELSTERERERRLGCVCGVGGGAYSQNLSLNTESFL